MKKVVAVLTALAMVLVAAAALLMPSSTASAASPGDSPQNPIVVGSVAEVPAGSVEDAVSTYNTPAACDTTRSWVHVKPAVNEVSHQEYRHKRDVPAVTELSHQEYKYKKVVPAYKTETRKATKTYTPGKDGKDEVSHNEWTVEKRTRTFVPGSAEVREYRFPKETRVWIPEVKEVKEYTFDKFKQYQKARWKKVNGVWVYDNAISYGYTGSYGWRDAGFAPVTNTTGVLPTAPGPVRGNYIHSNNGEWYYTTFYEYRKIGERVVTQGVAAHWGPWTSAGYTAWGPSQTPPANTDTVRYGPVESRVKTPAVPDSYTPWSAWVAYGNNPYLSDPQLPANTDTREYRKFGPVKVVDSAAVPATPGSWSAWTPQLDFTGGWTGAEPTTPPVKTGSGTYAPLTWTQTREVRDPANDTVVFYNNGDWTRDVLGSPWVKYDEKKVIDREAVPAYTEYYVDATTVTRDVNVAAWVREASIAGWTQFEERTVVDSAALPEVRTYYAWSDGKVCEVVTPPPTPEPPVVTPPTPEPPKDKVKPSAKIRANCSGSVAYVMNNKKSNVDVTYRYLRNGNVSKVTVDAGEKKFFVKKAKAGSFAWIKVKGMDTVKTRVPGPCHVPHAGFRK